MMRIKRIDQSGITITELLIVTIMTGFLVTLIATFTIGYWRFGLLEQADLDTLDTRLNAGDILRESIGTSSGLITQNSIADTHASPADLNDLSGTHWQLIHAVPGTISVGANGTQTPVAYYRRPSQNASGAYIMNGTQPYEDEFVLYLNGTTKSLMMRTLANPNASGDKLLTSCPPSVATPSCPADRTIASGLISVAARYFSRTGNLIDYTSITDPNTGSYMGPDFTAVEVVEFTLNISVKPNLQQTNATTNSTVIRVALRNA